MNKTLLLPKIPWLLGLWMLILPACSSVKLISDYDEVTDKSVTALQEKITEFFVKMETDIGTDAAGYSHYSNFYQQAKVNLITFKIRADAIDKNKIVQDQIVALTSMLNDLEQLHRIGFSNLAQIKQLEPPFNSAFTAIIKLQLALKRGEKK
jgi:hypothetical protein